MLNKLKQQYKEGDFSIAVKVSNVIMSLPMNPYLSGDEIGYIAKNDKGL